MVILWTHFGVPNIGALKFPWPGLDKAISITLYGNKPYAAVYLFQPLAGGTAILLAAILTALVVRCRSPAFFACVATTWRQSRIAILTVALIVGLAYLMNYSGMTYTLGKAVASVGFFFPLVSAFLGWLAVFLSGSDTSGNALFGNLQVVAANQLGLNPGADRRHQLVRRRDGQDDLAAEHRDRRVGDEPQGPGRRRLRPHLHAQHHPDARCSA